MNSQDVSRRTVLKGAAATAGALAVGPALSGAGPASAAAASRPNFVLIMSDDQGYGDLSSYGAPLLRTPNIDGMGERGIRFTEHYSGSPLCTPARAALMTGAWPPRVNMPNVLNPGQNAGITPQETLLPEYLRAAGYATGHFGKWHLGDPQVRASFHPLENGFDRWYGIPYSNDYPTIPVYDDRTIVRTIVYPGALGQDAGNGDEQNWLNKSIFQNAFDWIDAHAGGPFLAYIAPSQPHEPLASEFQGSAGGPHGSSIEEMDQLIGQLLTRLDALGVRENTCIVFTSDNGPWWVGDVAGLSGRKGETYEGGIKVPFVMEWPAGMQRKGFVYDGVTGHVDVLPTFCAAAGVPLRNDRVIDGRDILSVIENGTPPLFFARLAEVIDRYTSSGQITPSASRSLLDRLARAEGQMSQRREEAAVGYLEQLIARARNQIKGDAEDIAARDAIVAAAGASIDTLSLRVDVAYYQSDMLNAIRYGDWKLHVRRMANPTRHTGLLNWEATEEMPQLFDLSQDREEYYDLSEHHPDVLAEMQARLAAFDASLKADRLLHHGV